MSDLCLLTVHAHPDDEASKGAGTVARYHAEGVRTVLVTCTGGEEGDIHNPAMDKPEVREHLAAVRLAELDAAAAVIGFDEAIGRLVAVIRAERPQVILTYSDDQQGYPHPDHLRVHDISVPAFERAADPSWRPDLGDPWQPSKLYYTVWSRARVEGMHRKFLELGLESPFTEEWFSRPSQDDRITTSVALDGFEDVRWDALLAHATQVDPLSPFWFGLPKDVAGRVHPFDDYVLARSLVDTEVPEDDLFAGLR